MPLMAKSSHEPCRSFILRLDEKQCTLYSYLWFVMNRAKVRHKEHAIAMSYRTKAKQIGQLLKPENVTSRVPRQEVTILGRDSARSQMNVDW